MEISSEYRRPVALHQCGVDEALAALLALVGERVEVHVMDAGETPHLVATFGGRLRAGYSMTGGEPGDNEGDLRPVRGRRGDGGDQS